ncbi:hypothetical protein Tsubulata_018686, partial [Turnera subulata]
LLAIPAISQVTVVNSLSIPLSPLLPNLLRPRICCCPFATLPTSVPSSRTTVAKPSWSAVWSWSYAWLWSWCSMVVGLYGVTSGVDEGKKYTLVPG